MVKKIFVGLFVMLLSVSFVTAFSVSFDYPLDGTNYDAVVDKIDWSLSGINVSDISACWYTLDGGASNSTSSDCSDFSYTTFISSNENNNTWVIYANDTSGVVQSDSVTFFVDSIFPSITVNSPTDPDYFSSLVIPFDVDISEVNPKPFSSFSVYNSAGFQMWSWAYNLASGSNSIVDSANPMPSDGTYTLNISAEDDLGHVSTAGRVVILDSIDPSVSLDTPSDGDYLSGTASINTSATDDRSGIASIDIDLIRRFSGNPTFNLQTCNSSPCNIDYTLGHQDGNYTINVTAADNAGNTNNTQIDVVIDNTDPTMTFTNPASGNYSSSQSVSLTGLDTIAVDTLELYFNGSLVKTVVVPGIRTFFSISWASLGEGAYDIYGKVYDKAGNSFQTPTRNVIVDLTDPVVDAGADVVSNTAINTSASASDALSGIASYSWSEVNGTGNVSFGSANSLVTTVSSNTDGDFTIRLNVTDAAGNSNTDDFVLSWDTTPPVISLNGGNLVLEVFDSYVEAGANATDSYDGDLTGSIVTDSSSVNTSLLGSYNVTYDVSDSAGNAAQAIRTVDVVDTTNPVITLLGSDPESAEAGSTYSESGATASDNYDGDISGSIVIDSSGVDTNTIGNYTVYYNVTDSSGNADGASRTIQVVDTTAPTLSLDSPANNVPIVFSSNNVTLEVGIVDYSAIQSCDLILNSVVDQTNSTVVGNVTFSLFSLSAGQYVWSASCTDAAGNTGVTGNSSFTILSDLTFAAGYEYTDLSLESDISAVTNFYIRNEHGIINWSGPLDLSSGKNWADFVALTANKGDVNSTGASELNAAARVTLFNISFTDPRVLKDGADCGDCTEISYLNGSFVFDVTGFSYYESDETPVAPTPAPTSSSGGGGGGNGAGGNGNKIDCLSVWDCLEWNECVDGSQTRTCTLKPGITPSGCSIDPENPPVEVTTQECTVEFTALSGEPGEEIQIEDTPEESSGGIFQTITGAIIGAVPSGRAMGAIAFLVLILAAYFFVANKRKMSFAQELENTFGGK